MEMANKHMKRCSTSLIIEKWRWELQWDITSHQSEWPSSKCLQTINAGEGVEKREPCCTLGGNVNWYSHNGRQYGDYIKIKNTTTVWPSNPLGIYLRKLKLKKKHVPPMFIAALFIIVKAWTQPRHPLTDEWIKKLWYINIMEYYSAIKYSAFESILMR